jgi:hypothetical protein
MKKNEAVVLYCGCCPWSGFVNLVWPLLIVS